MKETHEIGPGRPTSAIVRGIYTGSDPKLEGETAHISRCQDGWQVQVDNKASDFAFGWWFFPASEWGEGLI